MKPVPIPVLDRNNVAPQPLVRDKNGVKRFKENAFVRQLLEVSGFNLNDLVEWDGPDEDWQQLMQLLGYSIGGYADLFGADDPVVVAADRISMP